MEHWKVLAGLVVLSWVGYNFVYMRPYGGTDGPLIDLKQDPVQELVQEPREVRFERGGKHYRAELKYRYEIQGRVVMASSYSVFYRSDLLVVDVGLAWGERLDWMLEILHFNQGGRWLFWQTDRQISVKDRAYIESHLSNNHLIPAGFDWNLEKALRWIDQGDTVRISGYLVDVYEGGRAVLRSSTTRKDKGQGACEVIWVDEVQIGDTVYGPKR